MKIKKYFVVCCVFLFSFLFTLIPSTVFAATTTKVITVNDLETSKVSALGNDKWFFYNDENDTLDNTLGSFVTGPGTPLLGTGSVQSSVTGSERRNLATYGFRGVKLSDITTLSFATYNPSAGNPGSPNRSGYLHFNVTFDGIDTWQRRLVYVPSANSAVTQNTWKEWDTINGGNALWTWSGFASNGNMWPDGNTAPQRTWNDIKTAFPNAAIRTTDSFMGVRVGEPYADGYTENIDVFKFGTASDTTTFDFEPLIGPPTALAECKNNGWQTFNNPSFKNKEKCEKYVEKNKKVIKGNDVIYTAYGLKREVDMDMNTADNGGSFEYDDSAKGWYNVKVYSVKVDGTFGYFAGRVVKASNPGWVGLWLLAKVEDGSPDKIWGSFTDEATALNGVQTMSTPADGPFNITKKKIRIK